ncbi:MAG: hypothetical protein Q4B77_06985 [Coriobacteriaceae bacterium]|nr:hypothetical protein [Coriobacteriaceae bacterium]
MNMYVPGNPPELPSPQELCVKLEKLQRLIQSLAPIAIGFSGGVDSTFLAAVCARCAPEQTTLIHLDTPFIASPEKHACDQALASLGLAYIRLPLSPLVCSQVSQGARDRCYHCKHLAFQAICTTASAIGCRTVLEGSNASDDPHARPGMRAVQELGARSPLMELGWTKNEERALLRSWGFAVWDMPAGACLATRMAANEAITPQKLDAIRACEDYLHDLGLKQVRVRLSSTGAHIQADTDGLDQLASLADPRKSPVPTELERQETPIPHHMACKLLELGRGVFSNLDRNATLYRPS